MLLHIKPIIRNKKAQEFDFGLFDFDEEVIRFIQLSIDILKENLANRQTVKLIGKEISNFSNRD